MCAIVTLKLVLPVRVGWEGTKPNAMQSVFARKLLPDQPDDLSGIRLTEIEPSKPVFYYRVQLWEGLESMG